MQNNRGVREMLSVMNYHSRKFENIAARQVAVAKNGMVATSQPLAAQGGLEILRKGGNAVDAAVAAATCLTVVEPTSNGIGADAFAIVYFNGKLYGLNSSGPAPIGISIDVLKSKGHDEMPPTGFAPVNVPGAPAAWNALSERFGALPLTDTLAPAIEYALEGFPLSPVVAHYWDRDAKAYAETLSGDEFAEWFKTFTKEGEAPRCGEVWRSPEHAKTLADIARTGAKSFYQGDIADSIDRFSRQYGGFIRKSDLAAYSPEWVDTLSVEYRGYDVHELPPNGQGMVALMALNILKEYELKHNDPQTMHRVIEAVKLSFADAMAGITDPKYMKVDPARLLSAEYAAERRALIGDTAIMPQPSRFTDHGTVYLCTADSRGNMVSFIQSNYMGFGSGLVVPGTGIALNNRGCNFSLDETHDNRLEGGKRSYHTIIPGFLMKNGKAVGPFGVMGGFMQPQGHVQVLINMLDLGMNPQEALDAPRFMWDEGVKVALEREAGDDTISELIKRGHDIDVQEASSTFGRGQIIFTDGTSLYGGTEKRCDGTVACW